MFTYIIRIFIALTILRTVFMIFKRLRKVYLAIRHKSINGKVIAGGTGEATTKRWLKKACRSLGGNAFVCNDLLIQENGFDSQIDHVLVSDNVVFVVETKNYRGLITGKMDETKIQKDGEYVLNPFYQNKGHIKALKGVLPNSNNLTFINLVCFPKKSKREIGLAGGLGEAGYAVNYKELKTYVEHYNFVYNKGSVFLDKGDLSKFTHYTRKQLKQHNRYVRGVEC